MKQTYTNFWINLLLQLQANIMKYVNLFLLNINKQIKCKLIILYCNLPKQKKVIIAIVIHGYTTQLN